MRANGRKWRREPRRDRRKADTRAGHPRISSRQCASYRPDSHRSGLCGRGDPRRRLCAAASSLLRRDQLHRLLTPEILLFAACALIGELVPLKVVTRGVEGEVTTSTTFAFAAMLVAGPACALRRARRRELRRRRHARQGRPPSCSSTAASTRSRSPPPPRRCTSSPVVPRVGAEPTSRRTTCRASLAAASVFFVVNSVLVSTVIALVQQLRIGRYLVQDWFFQVSTGGLMLGLAPMVAARRRLRAAVGRAAVPAAARRPPRRPRGDRQGAPGAARRAHRAAEPRRCSATASSRRSTPAAAPVASPP